MENKKSLIKLAVFASAAALLIGCSDEKEQRTAQLPPPAVEVQKPIKRMQDVWYSELADIQGESLVEVRARVGGYLQKINFRDGEYVKAGDVLFEIDPRPYEAAVKECEARLKEAEARIALATSNHLRAEELSKSNAISGEVLETRRAEKLSAEAAILSAQAMLTEASLNLEFTKVKAPISGYVSNRAIDAGNLVNASTSRLTTIVCRDVIYAYFDINNRDFVRLNRTGVFKAINPAERKGPPIRLVTDDGTEKMGMITYMDNKVDVASVQFRGEFKNEDDALFPGIFGRVFFQSSLPQEKILLPELAVGTDLVGRYVLAVDSDNVVKNIIVEVGEVVNGLIIIEKGLTGDEDIIVNGIQRAIPGRKVSPKFVESKKE